MKREVEFADMEENLRRGGGELLFAGPEGRVIRCGHGGPILSDVLDGTALVSLLQERGLCDESLFCLKGHDAADAIKQAFGVDGGTACTQAVYLSHEAPAWEGDIRLLTEEHAAFCAARYHPEDNNLPYMQYLISAGQMWGYFDGDRIAGFIGIHREGSMGLLEVLPEHRKRGVGYALEAFLIDWHLKKGWVPYCHVVEGNEASFALQRKLGMQFSELPVIWLWKD